MLRNVRRIGRCEGLAALAATLTLMIAGCGNDAGRKEQTPASAWVEAEKPRQPVPAPLAFFESALAGDRPRTEAMLASGIAVDSTNPQGSTALMLAAFNGHTDVARLLIGRGAFVDHRDLTGRTPVMYASSGPYAETVEFLLENGAAVNVTDTGEGFSAIMFAGGEGHTEVIKTLLAHGADANKKDVDGDTALTFAQRNGHREAAMLLEAAMKERGPS